MNLQYLIKYKSFVSVEEMDAMVQEHINVHQDRLTESMKEVLRCLASHSLSAIGACHLLTETIANEIGVSTQTVYRATKRLAELGIITKHKTTKKTGQGASIYVIAPKINTRNVSHQERKWCQSLETHVNAVVSTDSHVNNDAVTKNLITSSFNPFVVNNVNTYSPCDTAQDLKSQLRAIYQPQSVEDNVAFEELCKIAFGRIKQFMKSHNMPYLQMEQMVLNCMRALVNKQGVRNQFALYSAMIKRQVEQLFESFKQPQTRLNNGRDEKIPDWFYKRNEPSTVAIAAEVDFEAERQKVLAKLGAC